MEARGVHAILLGTAILAVDLDASVGVVAVFVDKLSLGEVHAHGGVGVERNVHDLSLHLRRIDEVVGEIVDVDTEDDSTIGGRTTCLHPNGVGTVARDAGIILVTSEPGPVRRIPGSVGIFQSCNVFLSGSTLVVAVESTDLEGHSHGVAETDRGGIDDSVAFRCTVLAVDLNAYTPVFLQVANVELTRSVWLELGIWAYGAQADAIVSQRVAVFHDAITVEGQRVGIVAIDLTCGSGPVKSLAVVDDLLAVAVTGIRQEDGVSVAGSEADAFHAIDGIEGFLGLLDEFLDLVECRHLGIERERAVDVEIVGEVEFRVGDVTGGIVSVVLGVLFGSLVAVSKVSAHTFLALRADVALRPRDAESEIDIFHRLRLGGELLHGTIYISVAYLDESLIIIGGAGQQPAHCGKIKVTPIGEQIFAHPYLHAFLHRAEAFESGKRGREGSLGVADVSGVERLGFGIRGNKGLHLTIFIYLVLQADIGGIVVGSTGVETTETGSDGVGRQ